MSSLIVAHADFEAHWPFVVDHWAARWREQGPVRVVRVPRGDNRELGEIVGETEDVSRLVVLGVPASVETLDRFEDLREATILGSYSRTKLAEEGKQRLQERGVRLIEHRSEGFWGESVAEFALGLTICALRQIPQNYHAMLTSHEPWLRYSASRNTGPGMLGAQYSDDSRFTNGTVGGKRVRIVGAGNIGSRYASFTKMMGADVAIWDPFAPEPNFHRSGARREWHLDRLVEDAEIFAPMLPLNDQTRGTVTAEHIRRLPKGCLVVLATRAAIVDVPTLRERVLADELALAADVFDVEPLPLDDPLLGRHNVVHTPHLAGRTRDANRQWVEDLLAQYLPV